MIRRPVIRWTPLALAATAVALVGPLAVGSSSCVLGGFDVAPPVEAPPDADVGCKYATVPPRPLVNNAGGGVHFVVALSSLDLGESSPASPTFGLDLDNACTCQTDKPTCKSFSSNSGSCDGPDGRDMATVQLFKTLNPLVGGNLTTETFNTDIKTGSWTLLLRVTEYNGQQDDDRVTMEWYLGSRFTLDGQKADPKWDRSDKWPFSEDSLDAMNAPKYKDNHAYVSAGTIVAVFPEAVLSLAGTVGNSLSIKLSGGIVMATLEALPNDGYALRGGLLAGRLTKEEMIPTIRSFRGPDGSQICPWTPLFESAKRAFCDAMDINVDRGRTTRPCGALSIGIGFETKPAQLGDPTPVRPPEDTCDNVADDPKTDSCPSD